MSKRRALRLAYQHQEFCAKRVAVLTSHLPHPRSPRANRVLSGKVLNFLELRDARYCGRCLKFFVEAVRPAGLMTVSGVALLYINWIFGVIVLTLTTVTMLTLRRVYSAAAMSSRNVEKLAEPAGRERRDRMSGVMDNTRKIDYENNRLHRDFATGMTRKYLDVLQEREWVKERAKLAIDLLTSVSLLIVLSIAAIGLLHGQWLLSTLLLFLMALRYFSASLVQLGGIFTSVSRAYPHLRRYKEFASDASRALSSTPTTDAVEKITLDIPPLQCGRGSVSLDSTTVFWLLHPGDSGRNLVRLLMDHTRGGDQTAHDLYRIVNERFVDEEDSMADAAALRNLHRLELREALAHLLPQDRLDGLSILDSGSSLRYRASGAPTPIDVAVAVLSAFLSRHRVILIDSRLEAELNPGWHGKLGEMFGPRVLIKTARRLPEKFVRDDDVIIISDREKLFGWARWRTAKEDVDLAERLRNFSARGGLSLPNIEDVEAM